MPIGLELEWEAGNDPYTTEQLLAAESRYGFRFPPDLFELYLSGRPRVRDGTNTRVWDWTRDDESELRERIASPLQGFLFDVEENALWWPEWGIRPSDRAERHAALERAFADAPKLIPIYGHRFIPAEPHEFGNPIFSVYQSDVIYYGVLPHPFCTSARRDVESSWWPALRPIRFWSMAVDRGGHFGGL